MTSLAVAPARYRTRHFAPRCCGSIAGPADAAAAAAAADDDDDDDVDVDVDAGTKTPVPSQRRTEKKTMTFQ